jgi:4-hydroxy-3-methylbut-2-enyl diphosphate reductase
MDIILAKSAGFCWGVQRAVEKARQLSREGNRTIWVDGPLIHNQQMMDQLKAEGIQETQHPETLKDGTLMIRAHGIPPARRAFLQNLSCQLMDATCPDVARIQGIIRKHARQGYAVIIYGDAGHAEVTGLLGFAEKGGFVVSRTADVDGLPPLDPVCLVSQSTQFPAAYEEIAAAVQRRFPQVKVLDTICASTKRRQAELSEIAQQADAIVIVGDRHSANTLRLVELARSLKPTFHVQTADQLNPADFKTFQRVGLSAGASTPAFIIDAVKARLETF